MSKTELIDNLTFASALQMLAQLVERGLLTTDEGARVRKELERKLRPTVSVKFHSVFTKQGFKAEICHTEERTNPQLRRFVLSS